MKSGHLTFLLPKRLRPGTRRSPPSSRCAVSRSSPFHPGRG
jgi:hypothetical protein